jgi:hypothetical protein
VLESSIDGFPYKDAGLEAVDKVVTEEDVTVVA